MKNNCQLLVLLGLLSIILGSQAQLLMQHLNLEFLKLENELWNFSSTGLYEMPSNEAEIYLIKKFKEFDRTLQQMPDDVYPALEPIKNIQKISSLKPQLDGIKNEYKKFLHYLDTANTDPDNQLDEFESFILEGTLKGFADFLRSVTFEKQGGLSNEIDRVNPMCGDAMQSRALLYYNLYNVLSLYELKAYIIQQFLYLVGAIENPEFDDHIKGSIDIRKNYEKRITQILNNLKSHDESSGIYACDPQKHVKGKTYDEVTRLLQLHVQSELDLGNDHTCKKTCSYYDHSDRNNKYKCTRKGDNPCDETQRCLGDLHDCKFVHNDLSMCISYDTMRRFDVIGPYGHEKSCRRATAYNWISWFVRCDFCVCLCDEESKSDRYISLRLVKANVEKNMVVTGVRLIKHNRIFYFQIQEGQLLPYGHINQSTVHWVPIDPLTIENEKEVFKLSYYHRQFMLDYASASYSTQVITGFQFWKWSSDRVYTLFHLNDFDWHAGTLTAFWRYSKTPTGVKALQPSEPDLEDPISINKPTTYRSFAEVGYSYLVFGPTSYKKDAGQQTVPFIDIQPIYSKPAVPLNAANLHWKTSNRENDGGFIAPLISTLVYVKKITSDPFPAIGDRMMAAKYIPPLKITP